LGVIVQVTLRARPIAPASAWFGSDRTPAELLELLHAPTAVTTGGTGVHVWLEGHPGDLATQARRASLVASEPATPPRGPHRGRISVPPGGVTELDAALDGVVGLDRLSEHGVGTVHVAAADPALLATARELAHAHDGWLLREAGAPELDPFGTDPPGLALQRRIRAALDPTAKLAPGRVPTTEPVPERV
jgi:hypothetical protein